MFFGNSPYKMQLIEETKRNVLVSNHVNHDGHIVSKTDTHIHSNDLVALFDRLFKTITKVP